MYKFIVLIELKLEIKEDLVQKKKLFKFLDPPQLLFFSNRNLASASADMKEKAKWYPLKLLLP